MRDIQDINFYVDVDMNGFNTFYYNMISKVNDIVANEIGMEIANRPINKEAMSLIDKNRHKVFDGPGPSKFGVMASKDLQTEEIEYIYANQMKGITAQVNAEIAEEVLERAKYYCPVKEGKLRDSGRIEQLPDGSCRIYFECEYAWYVHEFTWKHHEYPTRAKFLTEALYEVMKEHGLA
jgi:hypothetical protein